MRMDRSGGNRRRSVLLAGVLGVGLIAVAVALNINFIVLYWRTGLLLLLGVVSFVVLVGGLVLNTAFLIREIQRSEQHDAFIHAVTHELKTPLASIKLYLQTLRPARAAGGHSARHHRHDARRLRAAAADHRPDPARRQDREPPAASTTPPTST